VPILTSIKSQRNQKRVNVYLDDKFSFGIDLVNFVTLHLKVGQELSEKEVEKIVKKAEFQKTLDKLLKFATLRPRSEREINDYFKKKKVHISLLEDLKNKLTHFELLDDEKFAKWWVDQRLQFKSKSKRDLIFELRNKGIDKDTIDKVLGEVKIDEKKMAKALLAKKVYKWSGLSVFEAKMKKSQYLRQKGFRWEVIEKVVGEVVE
jgi:regulatory protein